MIAKNYNEPILPKIRCQQQLSEGLITYDNDISIYF